MNRAAIAVVSALLIGGCVRPEAEPPQAPARPDWKRSPRADVPALPEDVSERPYATTREAPPDEASDSEIDRSITEATDAQIEDFIAKHPKLPEKRKKWLRARTVNLGMSEDEVLLIHGKPADVNRTVGSFGTHEQWVYPGDGPKSEYLYFENGTLTGWQD